MAGFPTAFGESRPELGSEGLGSATQGSQPDLRRIVELPAPADFLSLSSETKPKLMTPDAFMTPSASLQQVCLGGVGLGEGGAWGCPPRPQPSFSMFPQIAASPSSSSSSSSSSLTAVSAMSSTSVVDPSLPR